ncbi:hypothetical protein BZL30_9507 [Mycobacterium kansasii]|uniref:Uncharacterized protein n=1 Tax=Mycobacterium kansasii TaxID=1768 RepID=A0A1V3W8L5_MYCKA|nr:hypothetical protein BZL30_9507 [Mycobacterium kansasii]
MPPMAFAQPPPPTVVVNHGSHVLTDTITAKSATSQPGRSRRIMHASVIGRQLASSHATLVCSEDRLKATPVGSVAAASRP